MTPTHKIALGDLDPSFLEFGNQPGVLRCHSGIRVPGNDPRPRQGLHFVCPVCTNSDSHGIILLFDDPSVPPKAQPRGRWTYNGRPLSQLTLTEKVYSRETEKKCNWEGFIIDGQVTWK